MTMQATLWRMANRPTVEDDDGGSHEATDPELLNMGIKVVGQLPGGDEIAHVEPGTDPPGPPDFTRIFNPRWTWDDVPPAIRDRVLEDVVEEEQEIDGETVTVRRRYKKADVPSGATVVETDAPPHFWYGDG